MDNGKLPEENLRRLNPDGGKKKQASEIPCQHWVVEHMCKLNPGEKRYCSKKIFNDMIVERFPNLIKIWTINFTDLWRSTNSKHNKQRKPY